MAPSSVGYLLAHWAAVTAPGAADDDEILTW